MRIRMKSVCIWWKKDQVWDSTNTNSKRKNLFKYINILGKRGDYYTYFDEESCEGTIEMNEVYK